MKKFGFLWKYLVLVPIVGAIFASISQFYYSMGIAHNDFLMECLFYGALLILFAAISGDLLKIVEPYWGKVLCFIMPAILYMGLVISANSYWLCLGYNATFGWADPLPFSFFVEETNRYLADSPLAEFLLCLAGALVGTLGLMLYSAPRIRLHRIFAQDRRYVRRLCQRDLEAVYLESIARPSIPSSRDLATYVYFMERNEENKKRLADLAAKHQDEILVYLILKHFGEELEREEYLEYRTAYLEMAQQRVNNARREARSLTVALPPPCRHLDAHFQVTDEYTIPEETNKEE